MAVVSLRGLPSEAEYGLGSIFYYVFAAIIVLVPMSLVAAELATGWPEKGGVFRWVGEAFGARWAFLATSMLHDKVGADPTGLPFSSVIALELHGGKPLSPLVNAGAICSTSLVAAAGAEERWAKILATQSAFAGRPVAMSDEVNCSEQATNFHNRAIAWLLRSSGFMYSDPMEACEVYTRQCSTLITTTDLATMGCELSSP